MFKTILEFLKLPQTWTGIAAFLLAFGVAGPALDFIAQEAANLALFFGLLSQFIGWNQAQVMSRAVNDYTRAVELAMYKNGMQMEKIDEIFDAARV